jgi:hypothetical protein
MAESFEESCEEFYGDGEFFGGEFNAQIRVALRWEDMRNDQIDMVEGDDNFNNIDVDNLSKCSFKPLTLGALEILGSAA